MIRKKMLLPVFLLFLMSLAACNNADQSFEGVTYENVGNDSVQIREEDRMDKEQNSDDNISSESTSIQSNQYPHTKAIPIKKAEYKFIEVESGEASEAQFPGEENKGVNQKQAEAPRQKQSPQQAEVRRQEQSPQQAEEKGNTGTEGVGQLEAQVVELTNVERRNNGLSELQVDTSLSNVATEKSNDMQENNYFSHTSPTYGSPFDMIRDMGVSYHSAAENIAQGQQTAEEVVESWMNSEGHRKNILNEGFTHIGIGYHEDGHIWTQMFISK